VLSPLYASDTDANVVRNVRTL